jgi:hypothetical protein
MVILTKPMKSLVLQNPRTKKQPIGRFAVACLDEDLS